MRIVINAGHTKVGKGTGANGFLNESIETRKIACDLMKLLADTKHEVIPAILDNSTDNLKEAVDLSNSKNADLFVSIHLNAGGGQGCECYTWKGEKLPIATMICENLNKIGFKNRGVKNGSKFYVIRKTKMTAIIIEVCFVDNSNDAHLYKKIGSNEIAKAIYNAIK